MFTPPFFRPKHSKFALFTFAKRGEIEHSFVSSPQPILNILASMSYEPWNSTLTPWSGPGTLGYPGTSNLRDGLYKAITEIKDKAKKDNQRVLLFLDRNVSFIFTMGVFHRLNLKRILIYGPNNFHIVFGYAVKLMRALPPVSATSSRYPLISLIRSFAIFHMGDPGSGIR